MWVPIELHWLFCLTLTEVSTNFQNNRFDQFQWTFNLRALATLNWTIAQISSSIIAPISENIILGKLPKKAPWLLTKHQKHYRVISDRNSVEASTSCCCCCFCCWLHRGPYALDQCAREREECKRRIQMEPAAIPYYFSIKPAGSSTCLCKASIRGTLV